MQKESQVVWEDPKEVEERMKLLEKMKSMETNAPALLEIDSDLSLMEIETPSSIDVDNIMDSEESLG